MSKLAIFLCAVLFASAIDASYLSDTLASAQQAVDRIVASEIARVERMYGAAKERVTVLFEKLEAAADSFGDKVAENIKKIEEKTKSDVDSLIGKTEDIDVSHCKKYVDDLHDSANDAISEMTACIVDKKAAGLAYVENINLSSASVLGNLTAIREETKRCGENADSFGSTLRAIACVKLTAIKSTWVATMSVPALAVNIGKMTYLLSSLQPSLAYCTSTHGLANFYHEALKVTRQTKICIQQKTDEVRRATPKDEYTTEKVEATEADSTEVTPTTAPSNEEVKPTDEDDEEDNNADSAVNDYQTNDEN